MDTLLERLSSGQIVAVVSILVGGIVAIVMIVSITKYQFQLLADETALSREKQNAEVAAQAADDRTRRGRQARYAEPRSTPGD